MFRDRWFLMKNQPYQIVINFRCAIERAQQGLNKKYSYFVNGEYYINGDSYTHAWLEILDKARLNDLSGNSYIVDITEDQLENNRTFLNNDTHAYVGHTHRFYR